jgi:predicted acylesterase/phospholipase RssA
MIKHLVISGGGPTGLLAYGALKNLSETNFFDVNKLESIYATSIGSIIAILITLKYDWNTLDDYIIKRPWEKIFTINPNDFLNLFLNNGLFSFSVCEVILKDLLEAKDLSLNITLSEYYQYNNINLNIFATELNSMSSVILSHNSFPNLTLVKAIEMSTCYPLLFKPIFYEDLCYVDGGLFSNYPLKECIEREKCKENEILAIKNLWTRKQDLFNEEQNLFQFIYKSTNKIIKHLQNIDDSIKIPYEVNCLCNKKMGNELEWINFINEREKRIELIDEGIKYSSLFLNYVEQLDSNLNEETIIDE